MTRFKIEDDFYLDEKELRSRFLSGAILYFRIPAEDWYHPLYNLKRRLAATVRPMRLGIYRTVEGGVWFECAKNLEDFFKLHRIWALYAIVRPSPFICGIEFGGLPTGSWPRTACDSLVRPGLHRGCCSLLWPIVPRLVPRLLDNETFLWCKSKMNMALMEE